jgi:hypothetical protein
MGWKEDQPVMPLGSTQVALAMVDIRVEFASVLRSCAYSGYTGPRSSQQGAGCYVGSVRLRNVRRNSGADDHEPLSF